MDKLTKDNIVFSKITQIYYKYVKGKLFKFAAYPGADPQWVTSAYSKGFTGSNWKIVSEEEFNGRYSS